MTSRLPGRAPLLALALALASTWSHALVFAVNEGVTYRVSNDEIRARYAAIAADLSKLLKAPVQVEPVGDYPTLRQGLASKAYDLALVHPAHISIGAMTGSGYQLIAVTKGYQEYRASFLVNANAPYKSLADLRGLKIGAPDPDSITAWMVRATLRDALGKPEAATLNYTRYQDAVPFMVEHTFTQAGATAANGLVKQWEAKGGKVLAKSRAVPIKHLIAGETITAAQLEELRSYFTSLDGSEAGRKKLEPLQVKGYVYQDPQALLDLGVWLGLPQKLTAALQPAPKPAP